MQPADLAYAQSNLKKAKALLAAAKPQPEAVDLGKCFAKQVNNSMARDNAVKDRLQQQLNKISPELELVNQLIRANNLMLHSVAQSDSSRKRLNLFKRILDVFRAAKPSTQAFTVTTSGWHPSWQARQRPILLQFCSQTEDMQHLSCPAG